MADNTSQQSQGGKAADSTGTTTTTQSNINSMSIPGPNFDRLYEQKRAHDPASKERRESLNDQKPQGVLGKMWTQYVGGPTGNINEPSSK